MKTQKIHESNRLLLIEAIQFFEVYSFRVKKNVLSLSNNDFHLLVGIKNVILNKENLFLTQEQLKLFIVILDFVNITFIETYNPPYNKYEIQFFKRSEKFMRQYNKFGPPEEILCSLSSKQLVYANT